MKKPSKAEQKQLSLREEYRNKTGIILADMDYMPLSGRDKAFICLIKGLLIFCVCYGMNMVFITSFDVPCSVLLIGLLSFVLSVFVSFFYYRKLFFNLGYIFLFIVFLIFSAGLFMLANSGINAVVNILMEAVDTKLNLGGVRVYQEAYSDRYVTVTCCLVLILFFYVCVLNSLISEYMSGIGVFLLTFPVLEICLYLQDTMNYFWVAVMEIPAVICILLRHSYKFRLSLNPNPLGFGFHRKKKEVLLENRDMKKQNGSLVLIGVAVIGFMYFFSVYSIRFLPFRMKSNHTEWKSSTEEAVAEFAMHGIAGYFNSYNATGGISRGRLGGVRQVTLDFQTDLILNYVPYTTEPVYLRAFVAGRYLKNQWLPLTNYSELKSEPYHFSDSPVLVDLESRYLKNLFDIGMQNSAHAKMTIENVGASPEFAYYPYYTDYDETFGELYEWFFGYGTDDFYPIKRNDFISRFIQGDTVQSRLELYDSEELYFYPLLYQSTAVSAGRTDDVCERYRDFVYDNYLTVPNDIKGTLQAICEQQGFGGDALTVVSQIQKFFRLNYTYTLSPGKTPNNRDFVTYFLTKQKKGYCVHFASAGAMLLRTMGIPARYVEGYCVDIATAADSDPVSGDEKWQDWYEGDDRLSLKNNEARVLSVEVNDSKAHAWVEIYLDGFGWYPVELTTGWQESGDEDDFWSGFADYMTGDEERESPLQAITNRAKEIGFGLSFVLFLIALAILLFRVLKRLWRGYMLYLLPSNKRLSNQFVYLNKVMNVYHIADPGNVFHLEAAEIGEKLGLKSDTAGEYAGLVEEASYGNRKLTKEELNKATKTFRNFLRKIRGRLKGFRKIQFMLR